MLPIDFDELFNRVDNNRRFIKTIVEKFFGNSDERVNEIRTLIKKKSFQEAKNSAHKIKGVLANLSMVAAKQTATEIEKFALNNDTDNSLKLTDKLENQIEEAQIYYNNNSHLFSEQ